MLLVVSVEILVDLRGVKSVRGSGLKLRNERLRGTAPPLIYVAELNTEGGELSPLPVRHQSWNDFNPSITLRC